MSTAVAVPPATLLRCYTDQLRQPSKTAFRKGLPAAAEMLDRIIARLRQLAGDLERGLDVTVQIREQLRNLTLCIEDFQLAHMSWCRLEVQQARGDIAKLLGIVL